VTGHADNLWWTLLLLLGASIIGPVLAVRLRAPSAVMLILLGILLGPAGIGVLQDSPTVSFLSEFGFLVLMFMAGMEIDFAALRNAGRSALLVPLLIVVAVFASAVAMGRFFALGRIEVLALSAVSVGMPLAMLKETAQDATAIGRHVMLTASLGEFVCILVITALELLAGGGGAQHIAQRIGQVVLLLGASTLLMRWARALVWWHPEPLRRLTHHHDVAELGVRVGLCIMLAFVTLSALAGVEPILGAFIGGALVGFVLRQKQTLEGKIAALGNGLFIPVFFIVVGVRFDASALDRSMVLRALLLAALAGVAKLAPSLLLARRGTPLRARLAAGTLLAAPLTLVVAVAAIGRRLELIDSRQQAGLVLVAMLVSIVFPVLFKLLVREVRDAAATKRGIQKPSSVEKLHG